MFVSQALLDCYRSTCWSFARFARFSSPVCDDWNTSKWWSRAATHLSRVTERSFPEKRLSTRQPKKINKIPQRVLETKSPKQEINKRKKFGVRGQSGKGQFPFPKPLAVLLCPDCCSALPCSYPCSQPCLGNLVWSKFGEGYLDAINHPPSGKFDDGRAYMEGASHGDLQLFNKTWADAYATVAAAAARSTLLDSSVAIPTLDDALVWWGIAEGGGVGWAKVGFPTCFDYVYLLILLVCGMENPWSQKKRIKKKRPKLRHAHMKRAVPHRSFGPCKWIGKRRFKVRFKIYRLRGQLKRRRLLHTLMLARSRRPVQNMTQYHATSCGAWFSQVVRWVCGWLGFRIGEASNPGPAGSRTTKRKAELEAEYHDDANLAQTLLTVLQNYQGQQSMLTCPRQVSCADLRPHNCVKLRQNSESFFAQVVTWLCGWLGIRVGEASHPGPAGSRASKRKAETPRPDENSSEDSKLAQALLQVLQNFQSSTKDVSQPPHPSQ